MNVTGDGISKVISESSFVGLARQGASCILGENKAKHLTTIVLVAKKYQVGSDGRLAGGDQVRALGQSCIALSISALGVFE
jgi:hypothetical protein